MSESAYWYLHGKNFCQAKNSLESSDKQELVDLIVNERYNNFLSRYADYGDTQDPIDPLMENGKCHGKRLPYQGWYWRSLDFANKKIPMGFSDGYVGFMANNKWDYHERYLTSAEFDHFINLVDDAMRINEQGGDVRELRNRKMQALEMIYPWVQSLPRLIQE